MGSDGPKVALSPQGFHTLRKQKLIDPVLSKGEELQIADLESPSPFLIFPASRSLGSLRVQELLFISDGWPGGTQVVQVSAASEILFAWKSPSP